MKRLGLVTLADVSAPKGKSRTSTIAVARLDNNLVDSRYGSFKITQRDFDSWQRNLALFDRIAIDVDHSSDRGGGTRAVGWITSLQQDGELLKASVDWTKEGARLVRSGAYRHISPTFVQDYRDQHGEKHGRTLLRAALTNAPVLRAGMPALSLSQTATFDGIATPRKRKKGRPMTKRKTEVETLSRSTDRKEIGRLSRGATPKQMRKAVERSLARITGLTRSQVVRTLDDANWKPTELTWYRAIAAARNDIEPTARSSPTPA